MARGISPAAKAAAAAGVVRPAGFVRIGFDSSPWRSWTGYSDIVIGGELYTGTGALLEIDLPSETADLTAHPLRATLSGVPNENLSVALNEPYQGRIVTIAEGFFDEEGQLLTPQPEIWTRARLDTMDINEGPETSTIVMLGETKIRDMRRTFGLLYTTEDQATLYPGDRFFDGVPTIADVQTYWGDRDIES